ncbi:flavodoxin domain-containing protein [Chitinophaga sp.]|uniref:flavodoxin domain-containing protein n=1 Tax=Chitinophaga sp. TaxID=1869181 RepID=UPI002F93A2DD
MKGIIIYKGKYGATRQYAIWLGNILDIPVVMAGNETQQQLREAEYIIMGTSVYIGKLQLRKWIAKHHDLLINKDLFLFLVAGTPVAEKEKLQGYITANISSDISTRCSCFFLPGKLEFNKLSLSDKILLRIGSRLAKSRGENIATADYNNVKREFLFSIVDVLSKLNDVTVK